jgi:hypothetical protein
MSFDVGGKEHMTRRSFIRLTTCDDHARLSGDKNRHAESVMKQCGAEWQAAKASGMTDGDLAAIPKGSSRAGGPNNAVLKRSRPDAPAATPTPAPANYGEPAPAPSGAGSLSQSNRLAHRARRTRLCGSTTFRVSTILMSSARIGGASTATRKTARIRASRTDGGKSSGTG